MFPNMQIPADPAKPRRSSFVCVSAATDLTWACLKPTREGKAKKESHNCYISFMCGSAIALGLLQFSLVPTENKLT
jgi:hypothetical protein